MLESEIQKKLTDRLEALDLPWLHIPQGAYKSKRANHKTTKDFADVQFGYRGNVYQIEIGEKDGNAVRNKARKERQEAAGYKWQHHGGVRFYMVIGMDEMIYFMKKIGLL